MYAAITKPMDGHSGSVVPSNAATTYPNASNAIAAPSMIISRVQPR